MSPYLVRTQDGVPLSLRLHSVLAESSEGNLVPVESKNLWFVCIETESVPQARVSALGSIAQRRQPCNEE